MLTAATFRAFIGDSTSGIVGILSRIAVPTLFTLAFLIFIWGVVNNFFIKGADETSRRKGREFILYGVIGMVVLFGVWAIIGILLSTLGIEP